jgi:hypothetical protein
MPEIAFPVGYDVVSEEWDIDVPAQVNRSGWTGTRKVIGLPGAPIWRATVALEPIATELSERALRAFLLKLKGVQNTFRLPAACSQTNAAGATVRTGANAGLTVPLQGLPANQTVLAEGQFLTVLLPSGHRRLVCLTADLNSNGVGQGTATFEPELGEVPAAGTAVELANPYALMALAAPRNGWSRENGVATFRFQAEEAR